MNKNAFYNMSLGLAGSFVLERAGKYVDDICRIRLITHSNTVNLSFDQVYNALCQTGLHPRDVYGDLATGEETERITLLTEALGLPQHALIGRGVDVKGEIIDADKESVRWLPEGNV